MKKILLIGAIVLSGAFAQAQEKKNKNAKVDIEVKGNCQMCKKRIEKAAFAVKGVRDAVWHGDHQILHLTINENKTDVLTIQNAIAKAGHDTKFNNVEVKTPEDIYKNLHKCCVYQR